MREIKFRAWNTYLNKYHQWEDFGSVYCQYKEINMKSFDDDSVCDFDRLIFEQYTGLTDKNGVEIYEGDIVEQKSFGYFSLGSDGVERQNVYETGTVTINPSQGVKVGANTIYLEYEVIGNIHEKENE